MTKVAIIHFNVIELYPPALNFLDILSNKIGSNNKVICITNKWAVNKIKYVNSKIKIFRIIKLNKNNLRLLRLIKYFYFNLITILKLLIFRPSKILYYETHSSFPVYFYKKYLNKRVDILIHYHEYMTEEEYKNGMFLVNLYHQLEKKFYNDAKWISLTNKHFVNKFLLDNILIHKEIVNFLPNYPLKAWKSNYKELSTFNGQVKFVFIGALDFTSSYLKEFCDWILRAKSMALFDIYSQQISNSAIEYLYKLDAKSINFKGYVNYSELVKVLAKYDIGLILYNQLKDNIIYNTTNKLFEYLACGLDVWFPEELLGAYDYITNGTYPKVLKIDFKNLDQYDLDKLLSREGLTYKPSSYFAEDVYEPFIQNYLLK